MNDPASVLRLVRDLVAIANAGGGRVVLGISGEQVEVGIPDALACRYDTETITDAVTEFTHPDRIDLHVLTRSAALQRSVVEIVVSPAAEPPLVLGPAGTNVDDDGQADGVFGPQSVWVWCSGRAELARRDDYRQWRQEAVDLVTAEMIQRLSLVVGAPAGSRIRVVADDEVLDEPSFLLARSAEVFRHRSEHLLTGRDLAYLWLNRETLDLDQTRRELLFQSALRKRATLYLWLTMLRPTRWEIAEQLHRAVAMRDRDKSDAAPSILLLAALYLDDSEYLALVHALTTSGYAHMREAAEDLPDRATARAQLSDRERDHPIDGIPLPAVPTARLIDLADELLRGSPTRASRRLPPIGLELLRRCTPYPDGPHPWPSTDGPEPEVKNGAA